MPLNAINTNLKENSMKFDTTNLKRQVEENPLATAGVGAAILAGASKLLDANSRRKNAKTWRMEVKRRTKKS